MNLNEHSFGYLFAANQAMREHFDALFQTTSAYATKSTPELGHYQRFLDSLINTTTAFEKSLSKLVEEFDKGMRDSRQPASVSQAFERLFGALTAFVFGVHEVNSTLADCKMRVNELTKNTKNVIHNCVNTICNHSLELKNTGPKFESEYRKYIRMMIQCSNAGIVGVDGKALRTLANNEIGDFNALQKLEDNVGKLHGEARASVAKNFDLARVKLEGVVQQQNEWQLGVVKSADEICLAFGKTDVARRSTGGSQESSKKSFASGFRITLKKDSNEQLSSSKSIPALVPCEPVEDFMNDTGLTSVQSAVAKPKATNHFFSNDDALKMASRIPILTPPGSTQSFMNSNASLLNGLPKTMDPLPGIMKRFLLDGDAENMFRKQTETFPKYAIFLRTNFAFENLNVRPIFTQLNRLGAEISPHARMVSDLILSALFADTIDFSKGIVSELAMLLEQKKAREYFVCDFALKKAIRFQAPVFQAVTFKRRQVQNLQIITQYFFINYFELKQGDFELILDFLRLLLSVYDKSKHRFIETCAKFPVFSDPKLWLGLHGLTAKTTSVWQNDILLTCKEQTGGQFASGLSRMAGLFGIETENSKENNGARAFDVLVSILFQLKLDFEAISDIMIPLARKSKVEMDHVRALLSRNQDLLISQVATISRTKSMDIQDTTIDLVYANTNMRLLKILKMIIPYLSNAEDVSRLVCLNRFFSIKKRALYKRSLAILDFSACPRFRQTVYHSLVQIPARADPLPKGSDPELAAIISLDVQRTASLSPFFDPVKVEQILNNISHPAVGNFPYYQGMNYLVTYLFVLFEGNELETYNFTMWLVERDFSDYFDRDLRNVRKLFFSLKKFMRRHLPSLTQFLEVNLKIDTEIIFAAWCLTLLTTVLQNQTSTPVLDDIFDLFVARGWPGFFQAILVLLAELEETLMGLNYDSTLIMLNELGKNNFREILAKNENGFKLKSKIDRFSKVTFERMKHYELEYEQSQMKIGRVWDRIDAKINEGRFEEKGSSQS